MDGWMGRSIGLLDFRIVGLWGESSPGVAPGGGVLSLPIDPPSNDPLIPLFASIDPTFRGAGAGAARGVLSRSRARSCKAGAGDSETPTLPSSLKLRWTGRCVSVFAKATPDTSGTAQARLPYHTGRLAAARAKSAARARAGFCQALASSSLLDASARERGCGWRSFR